MQRAHKGNTSQKANRTSFTTTTNGIFPTHVKAEQKPSTGRTQTLNTSSVALPDFDRWRTMKKMITQASLEGKPVSTKDALEIKQIMPSSTLSKRQARRLTTVQALSNLTSSSYKPVFGVQSPIVSGTSELYTNEIIKLLPDSQPPSDDEQMKVSDQEGAADLAHLKNCNGVLASLPEETQEEAGCKDSSARKVADAGPNSRRRNSSALSNPYSNPHDAILKPVIHYTGASETDYLAATKHQVIPETVSNVDDSKLSKGGRDSDIQTKLLQSADKTTSRMFLMKQTSYNNTNNMAAQSQGIDQLHSSAKVVNRRLTEGFRDRALEMSHQGKPGAALTSNQCHALGNSENRVVRRISNFHQTTHQVHLVNFASPSNGPPPRRHTTLLNVNPQTINEADSLKKSNEPQSPTQIPNPMRSGEVMETRQSQLNDLMVTNNTEVSNELSMSPSSAAKLPRKNSVKYPTVVSVTFPESMPDKSKNVNSLTQLQQASQESKKAMNPQKNDGSLKRGPGSSRSNGQLDSMPKLPLSPENMLQDQFQPIILQTDLQGLVGTKVDSRQILTNNQQRKNNLEIEQQKFKTLQHPYSQVLAGKKLSQKERASPPLNERSGGAWVMAKDSTHEIPRDGGELRIEDDDRQHADLGQLYLQGYKASISSQASNKFQQLKQRQINLEAPSSIKNNLMRLREQQMRHKKTKSPSRQHIRKQLRKTIDSQVQTSRNEQKQQYSTQKTVEQVRQSDTNVPVDQIMQNQDQRGSFQLGDSTKQIGSPMGCVEFDDLIPMPIYQNGLEQINMGMIDQESKIVITKSGSDFKNQATSRDTSEERQAVQSKTLSGQGIDRSKSLGFAKTFQNFQHRRRQVRRDQYVSDSFLGATKVTQKIMGGFSPTSTSPRVQTQSQAKRGHKESFIGYKTFKMLHHAGTIPIQQQQLLQRKSELEKPTSNAASSISISHAARKPANMLSQVLGIQQQNTSLLASKHQHSGFTASESPSQIQQATQKSGCSTSRQHQNSSQVSGYPLGAPTITKAQAREFNLMRSRIKSQGGQRHRYYNKKQNLYNLMASDFKRPSTQGGLGSNHGSVSFSRHPQQRHATTKSQGQEGSFAQVKSTKVGGSNQAEHEQSLEVRKGTSTFPSQLQTESIVGAEQPKHQVKHKGYLYNSTTNQFISCEDQEEDQANILNAEGIITNSFDNRMLKTFDHSDKSPILSSQNHQRSKLLNQRMDLPEGMTAQQAHYMMHKTIQTQHLQNVHEYHKLYKKRSECGRTCNNKQKTLLSQTASSDFKESHENKDIKTTLAYSGQVIAEPGFTLQLKMKTTADYVRSSRSTNLQVAVKKSSFMEKLNDDPKVPYQRSRGYRANEAALSFQDESYEKIGSHVAKLRSREKDSYLNEILKKVKQYARSTKNSQVKIGEFFLDSGGQYYLSPNQQQQTQGDMQSPKPIQIQLEGVPGVPTRRQIQILKVDASQGTSTHNLEERASIDAIEHVHMSTKLLNGFDSVEAIGMEGGFTSQNTISEDGKLTSSGQLHYSNKDSKTRHLQIANLNVAQEPMTTKVSKKQLETDPDEFNVKVKRQTLSPQPIDNHSKLINKNVDELDQCLQSSFCNIQQDYQIPQSELQQKKKMNIPKNQHTIDTLAPDNLTQKSQQNSNNQLNSMQVAQYGGTQMNFTGSARQSQHALQQNSQHVMEPKASSFHSGLEYSSLDKLNAVQAIYNNSDSREAGGMPGAKVLSAKKQHGASVRKRVDPTVARQKKLSQERELKKGIKISGVKMFNSSMISVNLGENSARSGEKTSNYNISARHRNSGQRDSIASLKEEQEEMGSTSAVKPHHKIEIIPQNTFGEHTQALHTLHASENRTPQKIQDHMVAILDQNYQQDRGISYDGISTEQKSPSLLRDRTPMKKQSSGHTLVVNENQILNGVIVRANTIKKSQSKSKFAPVSGTDHHQFNKLELKQTPSESAQGFNSSTKKEIL